MTTKIEWVKNPDGTKGETWNCITGCSHASTGCDRCYARAMTRRLQAMGVEKYAAGFDKVVCHENMLDEPRKWKKPRRIFVNSMSDTFHKDVPQKFIFRMFDTMRLCYRHTFLVLTKRSIRMRTLSFSLKPGDNIWLGVSVENQSHLSRIDHLKLTWGDRKFISFEPLLGPIPSIDPFCIDWVIVGCETGPGARPMDLNWVRSIRDNCVDNNIPFFFKQAMVDGKKVSMPALEGKVWAEYPKGYTEYLSGKGEEM